MADLTFRTAALQLELKSDCCCKSEHHVLPLWRTILSGDHKFEARGRRLISPLWILPSPTLSPAIRRIRREMNRCHVSQALSQHAQTDRLVDSDVRSASHRMCCSPLCSPSAGFQWRRNSDESPCGIRVQEVKSLKIGKHFVSLRKKNWNPDWVD